MDATSFERSLRHPTPPADLSQQLLALWHDGRGEWHAAHAAVDSASDSASAWVHAYLHRKEGDVANADYWYRQAGRARPSTPLAIEWRTLVAAFCDREQGSP